MYTFGKKSQKNVETCVTEIEILAQDVLEHLDITCLSGKRGKVEQNSLYGAGMSKLKYPKSAHNTEPLSMAGDFAVWDSKIGGVNWNSLESFCLMRELFSYYAGKRGFKLKPMIVFSNGTGDWPHIELDM